MDFFLLCCFCMMVLFSTRVYLRYRDSPRESLLRSEIRRNIFKTLKLYPLVVMLCWLPNLVFASIAALYLDETAFLVCNLWATQTGSCLALLFFSRCFEARQRWAELLCPQPPDSLQSAQDAPPTLEMGQSQELSKHSMNSLPEWLWRASSSHLDEDPGWSDAGWTTAQ